MEEGKGLRRWRYLLVENGPLTELNEKVRALIGVIGETLTTGTTHIRTIHCNELRINIVALSIPAGSSVF